MRLRNFAAAAASLLAFALPMSAENYATGRAELNVPDPAGARALSGFLWYPAPGSAQTAPAHGNPVWAGIEVAPGAPMVGEDLPLVVLSHGMYGNAHNQAWLAQELTRAGYMVAAIDHPGTSTFSREPEARKALWERPRDISRTIDHVLALDQIGSRVDRGRIFMAGHSLGGFTAVALAGGRFDAERFDAFCASGADPLVCGIFSDWQVAKSPEDRARIAEDLSDPRIAGFAVFDLGGTQTFAPESLAKIDRSMLVIGAPVNVHGMDIDIESRALAALLPPEHVTYLEPESLAHFDFLGQCTEQALDILKEEEPDDLYVCADGTDARAADHALIERAVRAFFAEIE